MENDLSIKLTKKRICFIGKEHDILNAKHAIDHIEQEQNINDNWSEHILIENPDVRSVVQRKI